MPDTDAPTPRSDMTLVLRRSDLARRSAIDFELQPGAEVRAALAKTRGLERLRKLRFAGALHPLGRRDWELRATLGATVTQACVVSLAPVTTRIDEAVERRFLADFNEPKGVEIETPEDENSEALGDAIDLGAVGIEALMLALPAFPRAEGEALGDDGIVQAAPQGQAPLQDTDLRPFAGLAALRDRMTGGSDDGTS